VSSVTSVAANRRQASCLVAESLALSIMTFGTLIGGAWLDRSAAPDAVQPEASRIPTSDARVATPIGAILSELEASGRPNATWQGTTVVTASGVASAPQLLTCA
jgi:hypothetical protein